MNFSQLFGNTGDGVYAVDSDGIIRYWNAAAEKILGHSAQKVVGLPCRDVLNGRDRSCNRICRECCAVQVQASDSEPLNHFEMFSTTSSGKPIWLDVSVINIQDGLGRPKAIVHLFRDATFSHDLQSLLHDKACQNGIEHQQDSPTSSVVLTAREREVLSFMKQGANTAMTAEKLYISRATVRNHVQNIFSKLGVHTRLEAVAYMNGQR